MNTDQTNGTEPNNKEEPIDTSAFINDNFFLVLADKLWTNVFNPIFTFFENLKERFTRHWVEDQLDDIDERQVQQEAIMAQALKDAEEYRNSSH